MAANIPKLLLATLEELLKGEMKKFNLFLTQESGYGFRNIPRGALEEADRADVVDRMVQAYGRDGALEITLNILRDINQNNLVEKLLKDTKRKEEDGLVEKGNAPEGPTNPCIDQNTPTVSCTETLEDDQTVITDEQQGKVAEFTERLPAPALVDVTYLQSSNSPQDKTHAVSSEVQHTEDVVELVDKLTAPTLVDVTYLQSSNSPQDKPHADSSEVQHTEDVVELEEKLTVPTVACVTQLPSSSTTQDSGHFVSTEDHRDEVVVAAIRLSTPLQSSDHTQKIGEHDVPVCHSEVGRGHDHVTTNESSKSADEIVATCQAELKSCLIKRYCFAVEETANEGMLTPLNKIFTELYITEEGRGGGGHDHELRHMEMSSKRTELHDTQITCHNIFNSLGKPTRVVLTKGVAGIGKTFATQKFILDWAEGKANQDIQFIFPLPFRELNLIRDQKLSFTDLLHQFFGEIKTSTISNYDSYKILFIFDGLDECRLPFNFSNNVNWRDATKSTSLDVLLTSLIKGSLLPSALLWITSRPVASHQIPPGCVDLVTEVRGFNDPQKEEYFRKRFPEEDQANRIIEHIQTSRSLHIMCHIPVICLIIATVLERMLSKSREVEIPETLTQMYIHFLAFQATRTNNPKRQDANPFLTRDGIVSLGKLAFQQLEKGNLIFYEEDLRECGIDCRDASVYTAVCKQIFIEEGGLFHDKVFCFVHLSFQEFLAALYVYLTFHNHQVNLVSQTFTTKITGFFKRPSSADFLKSAVDMALQRPNGNLDLFLRFLLGFSLESNHKLIGGLLTRKDGSSQTSKELVKYIKVQISNNPSSERCINLFHCLNELNYSLLADDVQSLLSRGLDADSLTSEQWSAVAFVLLTSDVDLEEFELKDFSGTEKALLRLLPVVKASKKASLADCELTWRSCKELCLVLSSKFSSLRTLDLSDNNLLDSGVRKLCEGLSHPQCQLETLRLSQCGLTKVGFSYVACLLSFSTSHLKKLHLGENNPGDAGIRALATALESPHCKLETLSLPSCREMRSGFALIKSAVAEDPSDFFTNVKDSLFDGENPFSDLWEDEEEVYNLTNESYEAFASALSRNCHLTELDLSDNALEDSGVRRLCVGLKNPRCRLEILRLSSCEITSEGCACLASALRLNPSHLRELYLVRNGLKTQDMKLLTAVKHDPNCRLETLTFC